MSGNRGVWALCFTLVVAGIFLLLGSDWVLAIRPSPAEQSGQPRFEAFLPDGFQVDKVLRHDFANKGYAQYILAISDHIHLEQPLMLLYLDRKGTWFVKDKMQIHPRVSRDAEGMFEQPNYFNGLALAKVGSETLTQFASVASFGGSGAVFFFDFYRIRGGQLVLVKTFQHERMEQTYFCIDNGAVYDATFVNVKGKKVGKSFVHTYYLDVTKYTFDGVQFVTLGH